MYTYIFILTLVFSITNVSAQERFPITIDPAASFHEAVDAAKTLAMIAVNSVMGSIDGAQQLVTDLLDAFIFNSHEAKRVFRDLKPSGLIVAVTVENLMPSREFIDCLQGKGKNATFIIEDAVQGIESCLQGIRPRGQELSNDSVAVIESFNKVFRNGIHIISKCVEEQVMNVTGTESCLITGLGDIVKDIAKTSGPKLIESAGRARYLIPSVAVCIALRTRIARDRMEHLALQVPLCINNNTSYNNSSDTAPE